MKNNLVIDALKWRYATKKFDLTKKVIDEDFNELIEATRLSASSYGLQPWKLIVVKNKETREKLKAAAWNQPQITDSSHLIVFCAKKSVDSNYVKEYIALIARERGVSVDSLKEFEEMMIGFVNGHNSEFLANWTKMQTYIALGTLLETAAIKRIDACPMEGFDSAEFDKILGLEKEGLASAVVCAIGYRSKEDKAASYKKVRFPVDKLVIEK